MSEPQPRRFSNRYIGLYADKNLKTLITQRGNGWYLNFGHLDVGEKRTFKFFLENQSMGVIQDLEINLKPVEQKGINVRILGKTMSHLKLAGVHEFHVVWEITEEARAGKCQANLNIAGMITEELKG